MCNVRAPLDAAGSSEMAAFAELSRTLTPLLQHHNGAFYGSWAIALQAWNFPRIPKDLDVELVASRPITDVIADLSAIPALKVVRHERVRFSSDHEGHAASSPVVGRALLQSISDHDPSRPILVGFKLTETVRYPRILAALDPKTGSASIPLLPLEVCLSQKIVRLSLKRSFGRRHTRWRDAADLFDLLCTYRRESVSPAGLISALREEWNARGPGTEWRGLLPAPAEWSDDWDTACFVEGVVRPAPWDAIRQVNSTLVVMMKEAGATL
jgi:hypothetical protein